MNITYKNILLLRMPAIIRKIIVNIARKSRFIRYVVSRHRSLTHGDLDPIVRAIETIDFYNTVFEKIGGNLKGKEVLEIGTGDNLLVPVGLVALGCKKVVTIDPVRYLRSDNKRNAMYKELLKHYAISESLNRILSQIVYVNVAMENIPESWTNHYDLIVSYSVIEHVASIKDTFLSASRALKYGGHTIHKVDLASHNVMKIEGHPLEFLMYPSWLWSLLTRKGSINRKRYGEIMHEISNNGLGIDDVAEDNVLEEESVLNIIPSLALPYRNMSSANLKVTSFSVAAKKVRNGKANSA